MFFTSGEQACWGWSRLAFWWSLHLFSPLLRILLVCDWLMILFWIIWTFWDLAVVAQVHFY
jgi:hypothetical protein